MHRLSDVIFITDTDGVALIRTVSAGTIQETFNDETQRRKGATISKLLIPRLTSPFGYRQHQQF